MSSQGAASPPLPNGCGRELNGPSLYRDQGRMSDVRRTTGGKPRHQPHVAMRGVFPRSPKGSGDSCNTSRGLWPCTRRKRVPSSETRRNRERQQGPCPLTSGERVRRGRRPHKNQHATVRQLERATKQCEETFEAHLPEWLAGNINNNCLAKSVHDRANAKDAQTPPLGNVKGHWRKRLPWTIGSSQLMNEEMRKTHRHFH